MSERKLYKIRNASFGDILLFLNSLMLRHHFVSKNQNLIQNLSFRKDLTVLVQTLNKKAPSKKIEGAFFIQLVCDYILASA